jgi:hypothetical protein
MDKTLGCLLNPGRTAMDDAGAMPDQIEGVISCDTR